jgi:hypothetical protein
LDSNAVLPGPFTFTIADQGVHTLNVIVYNAGFHAIRVSDVADSGARGSTGKMVVTPGALDHFAFIAPPTVNAGESFMVTVMPKDAYGNTITNFMGTVHFNCTDGDVSYRESVSFTSRHRGVTSFNVILRNAGEHGIRFWNGENTEWGDGLGLTVLPGAVASFSVSAPTAAIAGEEVSVVVTALDEFGNTITDYTGTVHFNSPDSANVLPADYTFTLGDQGTHTFTVTMNSLGKQGIRVTDVANPDTMFGGVAILVNADRSSPSSPSLSASEPGTRGNAAHVRTIDRIMQDSVAGVANEITNTAPSSDFVVADDGKTDETPLEIQGTLELELVLNTPGTQTITVTLADNPEITGTVDIVVLKPEPLRAVGQSALIARGTTHHRPAVDGEDQEPRTTETDRALRRTVVRKTNVHEMMALLGFTDE